MENTAKLVINKISDEFERSEFEIVVEKPPEDIQTPEKSEKKNFVCQYCEKNFDNKGNWQSHLAYKHKDYSQIKKLYVCDFCDHYKTIKRRDLERHLEKKHEKPTVSLTLTAYLNM